MSHKSFIHGMIYKMIQKVILTNAGRLINEFGIGRSMKSI